MNNLFHKNLQALASKNPKLAKKIEDYIPTDLPQLVQKENIYNLLYKETLVHNAENPIAEAQEIFSMAENTPVAIHLIYGLGLGYLFQIATVNSKGSVILYEPDLNILWLSLKLVDFTKEFLKENVYVSDTFEEISEAIYKKSGIKNSPQLLSLPSQRVLNKNGFEDLVLKLKKIVGTYYLDLKFTKEKFYPSFKMLMQNVPSLINETPLARYKDSYRGKTAVIVSAGPTLDRNIEILKQERDKYILFVVGTAAKTIYQNGLKPDFIVLIETYNSTKQLEGLDLEDVCFITEPYSHPELRKFNFKHIFSHISANSPLNQFWGKICEESIEEYWSKGTVSYTALNCARLLGFSKIILVGQDLAYIEGQCYSKDSAYKNLKCGINPENGRWEIMADDMEKFANAISSSNDANVRLATAKRRLKNLNSSLYLVKGIQGDMIPTESVYAAFVEPLQEYVAHFNDREYINTSLVGAQLNGFKNQPLKDALQESEPVTNIIFDKNIPLNRNILQKNLEAELDFLKTSLPNIENGLKISKNLNNEIKRYRNVTQDILKTLKKLSIIYLNLSTDFTSKSKMFDFATVADRVDLDYEMKMTQDFTVETIDTINKKIALYLENAKKRIVEVETITRRAIDESLNTKG